MRIKSLKFEFNLFSRKVVFQVDLCITQNAIFKRYLKKLKTRKKKYLLLPRSKIFQLRNQKILHFASTQELCNFLQTLMRR